MTTAYVRPKLSILSPISPIFVGAPPSHPCDVVTVQSLTLPNVLVLLRGRLGEDLLGEDLLCGRRWELPLWEIGRLR
ncbi:hypothetical protein CDEST_14221 [Colletotrichum destructivum]|uniref:Uncharacterized protein n=1 Tax=Colletotrichum destructivum TaxID=34406 RepID=A0AAX4J1E9_9PEZI|nr:hypothetical protein CDEST_14221 [Colletotrichum destructivum]